MNELDRELPAEVDLDGVVEFGEARELTLGMAGPYAESGVPQRSHVR
jgi:hypothetical protein